MSSSYGINDILGAAPGAPQFFNLMDLFGTAKVSMDDMMPDTSGLFSGRPNTVEGLPWHGNTPMEQRQSFVSENVSTQDFIGGSDQLRDSYIWSLNGIKTTACVGVNARGVTHEPRKLKFYDVPWNDRMASFDSSSASYHSSFNVVYGTFHLQALLFGELSQKMMARNSGITLYSAPGIPELFEQTGLRGIGVSKRPMENTGDNKFLSVGTQGAVDFARNYWSNLHLYENMAPSLKHISRGKAQEGDLVGFIIKRYPHGEEGKPFTVPTIHFPPDCGDAMSHIVAANVTRAPFYVIPFACSPGFSPSTDDLTGEDEFGEFSIGHYMHVGQILSIYDHGNASESVDFIKDGRHQHAQGHVDLSISRAVQNRFEGLI